MRVALSGLVIFICYPGLSPWVEKSRASSSQNPFPPNKIQIKIREICFKTALKSSLCFL